LPKRGDDPAAQIAVTLLRLPLPADPATWATLAMPAITGPAASALATALDALDPTGGALPGDFALPVGASAADSVLAIRRPPRPISPGEPVVVSFNTDFTGAGGSIQLLLALVHATADPLTLPGGALRDVLGASSHVAARSVVVLA